MSAGESSDTDGFDPHDAIVLAGGRASRLGGAAKPGLLSGGVPLLHLALDAAATARRIAVVGPDDLWEPIAAHAAAPKTVLTMENPPFGGPVAGIAAGLAALETGPPWVLVVAVDVPRAAGAVPQLVRAVRGESGADGAHLVAGGRAQWLVGVYRADAVRERLAALGAEHGGSSGRGASVRRLLTGLRLLEVPDPGSLSADVDTWDDAERLGIRPGTPPKERP